MSGPPFGRIAASALVKAAAWTTHHDPAAALFFATLDRLPGIDAIVPSADRAVALTACERAQNAADADVLAVLALRAQSDARDEDAPLVTPHHLLAVTLRASAATLDRALSRVGVARAELLRAVDPIACLDEAPGPSARYVVVVRGNDFLDASNAYDTLNDARRARAALRERAFNIPMGMRDRADPTPFWLRVPERIAEATDISIRDLDGS